MVCFVSLCVSLFLLIPEIINNQRSHHNLSFDPFYLFAIIILPLIIYSVFVTPTREFKEEPVASLHAVSDRSLLTVSEGLPQFVFASVSSTAE